MPFSEAIKIEARRKAGYVCCVCRDPSTGLSLEVHHIIPQENGGLDTLDNAVALCPTHHSDFGANTEKIRRIRETRDWWYEQVKNMYQPYDSDLIKKMSTDLSDTKNNIQDLKKTLTQFTDNQIKLMTPENAHQIVSSIVGSMTGTYSPSVSPSPSPSDVTEAGFQQ